MQNHIPRLLLSATGSDSGKTTMMLALLSAFQKSGVVVQSYKSGPDYIDPMFHSRVIGAKSRNLDLFMLGQATTRYLVAKNARHADVAVFEGAMGFYDGMGKTTEASAYDLACTCDVPVVLVVNGKGAALSIAATIKGFKEFRSDSHIVGAILNNVNPMSYIFYKDVIERETGVKLLGYFPVMQGCNFESRHLGLVTAEEIGDLQQIVAKLAAQAAKLGAEALRHLLGHGRGSRLIGGESERHHGAGDAAADLTAAHTAAEAGRDTLCRAFVQAGLFLQRCEHALRAVKAVVVISNGGFLNTHGSLSPFLSDCL